MPNKIPFEIMDLSYQQNTAQATSRYRAFVFDLDGTLLDTLADLAVLTNRALERNGFPPHSEQKILSFVGNGLRPLIQRALPEGADSSAVDKVMRAWQEEYLICGTDLSKPYPGIPELLADLKARGKKLAVLSNKFDKGVQDIIPKHFPGVFDAMHGECAEIPRKPDPTGLLFTAQELGVSPEDIVYVGDSGTDMLTGRRVGAFTVGVTWGYCLEAELRDTGAQAVVRHPSEILAFAS